VSSATENRGGSIAYVYLLAVVAALGGLLFGYDTAVISGAIGFLSKHFQLNPDFEKGWAAASVLLGCAAGAALTGSLSDRIGRKKVLVLSGVLFFVSAVGTALPQSVTVFVVFRIIGGVAIGAASISSPMYIAEISPARIRGKMVSVNQFAIVSGILVSYFVSLLIVSYGDAVGVPDWNVHFGWRWMFAFGAFPAILLLGLLLTVPESPRFLTKQGRETVAQAVLSRISGPEEAAAQLTEIRDSIAHEVRLSSSWLWFLGGGVAGVVLGLWVNALGSWLGGHGGAVGVLAVAIDWNTILKAAGCFLIGGMVLKGAATFWQLHWSEYRRPGWIAVVLAELQQITGINVFLYFAPEIFKKMGSGVNVALLQTVVVGTVNIAFTVIAIRTVDRWGRKPLMLVGSAGMGLTLLGMGAAAYIGRADVWVLTFILGYIACFALSVGPVTWVILSEIFPTRIRGQAMAIATVCLWLADFVVTQTFPMMDENVWLVDVFHRAFPFLVYAFFCVVSVLFVWRCVPETKGKTLEEIERSWR